MSYYYWCGNHLLIQRVLSSKSQLHAKYGAISASFLKILPVWMMCIPGICAVLLFPEKFCKQEAAEYDAAYPTMVLKVLPKGLVGLVVAAMLSALMSSLAAVYNSAATIITNDIYKLLFAKTNLSDQKLVLIGRVSACVFVCISLLWLPMIQGGQSELFSYTQAVSAYIQNPLAVVYCLGTFWDRANVYGAYAAIIIGFIIGFTRFIMSFGAGDYCDTTWFCHVNFLYFGMILLGICVISMVIVSLITPAPPKEKVSGLTYWSIVKRKEKRIRSGDNDNEDKTTALLSGDGYQGTDEDSYDGNKSIDRADVEMHRTSSVAYPEISRESKISNPALMEDEIDDEIDDDTEIQQSLQPTKQSGAGEILASKKNTDYDEYKEEELEDVEDHKCGCCWNLIHLKGDKSNPKWNRIANVLTLIAICAVLTMFIVFR